MSRQEVQVRLDEASKMVLPENQKFLPPELQKRTGLELNPLWMMECLVRSGTLNPNQMVNALKTLSEYTHSKAPSQSLVAHAKAEDFLLQLAEESYPTVIIEQKPKRAANGTGKNADVEQRKRERYKANGWLDEKGAYIPKRLRDANGRQDQDGAPPSPDGLPLLCGESVEDQDQSGRD